MMQTCFKLCKLVFKICNCANLFLKYKNKFAQLHILKTSLHNLKQVCIITYFKNKFA